MRILVAGVLLAGLGVFAYFRLVPDVELPPPPPLDREAALELPEGKARVSAGQRSDTEVPGSDGRLRIHLGDITREQVALTLAHRNGRTLIPATSVRRGDSLPFRIGGERYALVVVELHNKLIGVDFAVIDVVAGVSEAERIEALLDAMRESEGLVFIRNGREYGAGKAADHLRRKWDTTAGRIRTAEQFIELLATKSSMSGKAYMIRLRDGTLIPSAEWLAERLRRIDGDA
ncbi:MAG: DUF5329 family protein [Planctomycetota bacterium]|jgi:hypothetical protein